MKVIICDLLVAKISFQSSSQKPHPSDGGKAQTLGPLKKKRLIRIITRKKEQVCPHNFTTLS